MTPNDEKPSLPTKKKLPPKKGGFKSARTGVAQIPTDIKKKKKVRWIFLLLLLLLLLGLTTGLLLWFLLPSEFDFCSIEGVPTEYEILNCERQTAKVYCEFDVSECPDSCLLSYKQDPFGCFTSCECAAEGLLESDVQFSKVNLKAMMASYITEEDSSFRSSAVSIYQTIWDWNVVNERVRIPYSIAPSLNGRQKTLDAINEAIALFSKLTCVDFVPYTEERDFIEFIAELNGCRSYVGRISGRQWINLSKDCFHLGNIVHLMLHTLGFWHENSRPERDDYVTVNMDNVSPGNRYNFKPLGSGAVRDINSTYDINSITHFGGLTFSKDQYPTIVDKAGTTLRAQRLELTQSDIDNINNLYICLLSPGFHENQEEDHWGPWGDWQLCSASCGDGQRSRFRECLDKENTIVYKSRCPGEKYETEKCSSDVACKPGTWGKWSPCTVTCNSGIRHRTSCCLPDVEYETEKCTEEDCPDDISGGFWLAWKEWGSCSRSCGSGWRRRSRNCNSKFWKVFEVRNCPWQLPSSVDIERCQTNKCNSSMPPPTWTPFGNWTECTSTCGNSVKYKYRYCRPEGGKCVGLNSKMEACKLDQCPPHTKKNVPSWEFWSPWAICKNPCDETTRTRSCFATNYNVVHGCTGKQSNSQIDQETRICSVEKCSPPVEISQLAMTEWSQWSYYVGCRMTCGRDLKQRVRKCIQGQVETTGCPGEAIDRKECGLLDCILWTTWGPWENCPIICGTDSIKRVRKCMQGEVAATGCPGDPIERRPCDLKKCALWSIWGPWGNCPVTCGSGTIKRVRKCVKGEKPVTGCPGHDREENPCFLIGCALWTSWDPWEVCSVTCGSGTVTRYRKCKQSATDVATTLCPGEASETKSCSKPQCQPRVVTYAHGPWSTWNPLECTCALRGRSRLCREFINGVMGKAVKLRCVPAVVAISGPCKREGCDSHGTDDEIEYNAPVTYTYNGTEYEMSVEEFWADGGQIIHKEGRQERGRLALPDAVERWNLPPRPSCDQGWEGVLDVNSDGADDIICIVDHHTLVTLINNNDGGFTAGSEENFDFCQFGSGTLLLGDFNGDQSQDIFCFDRINKVARVTWRQGSTFAASWYDLSTGDFCSTNTASLRVHHMNDDRRSDLVCVFQDGQIAVLLNQWTV